MARTTIDIDNAVLRELKKLKRREGKSLGRLVSELLAASLAEPRGDQPGPLGWTVRPMRALVDLDDKEAVRRALGDR
jgi:hypothetical protein